MSDSAPWMASTEWQALLRHFDFQSGFGFAVIFVADRAGAEACRTALAEYLRASQRTLLGVSPRRARDLHGIAGTLLAIQAEAETGAVWVAVPVGERDPAFADWSAALTEGLARLNSNRNSLAATLPCTLVLCVPPWAQTVIRDVAPDLWSVRSVVARIEMDPEGGLHRYVEAAPLLGGRDPDAPDAEMALAEAAKLRGKAGQEQTLARVLRRAGAGLLNAGQAREAAAAMEEAATAAERSRAPVPLRAEMYFAWGEALEALGQAKAAIERFETAADLYREAGDVSMLKASLARAPFDVFLSHSSKDKKMVRGLAERLRRDGVRVWFDEWEIQPGDSIAAKLEEGLERSRLLVLCMSANAFGSEWAQLEAGTFRFRDPLNRRRRFLPLRLDDAPAPGSLAQFLYLDWRNEGTYEMLLAICLGEKPRTSAPAAAGEYLERLIREVEAKARLYSPLSGVGAARRPDGAAALLAAWDDPEIALLRHSSRKWEAVETREYDDILTAFQHVPRAALLGAPGGGKSTTLRRLALELAQRALADANLPWPVMAELGRWVGDESLLEFLAAETPDCEIRLERVVLLLDGLNEVPTAKRGRKAREVRELAGRAAVIVSCRAEDYTGELDLGLDTLTLEPLTPQRVRAALRQWTANGGVGVALGEQIFWELAGDAGLAAVLEKWRRAGATEEEFWAAEKVKDYEAVYKATSGADDALWEKHVPNPRSLLRLAANPFLLTMLYQVRVAEGSLPQNRGELFDRFIRRLLSRERLLVRDAASGEWRMQAAGQALLDGLAALAWKMSQEGGGVLTVVQRSAAEAALGGALLKKALDSTILEGGEELRFRHQLLQEYFTARAMRERLVTLRAAELWPPERWWGRTGWEEATVLLAGLYAEDSTPVVRWVAEAQPELAVQCLLESGAGVADRAGLLGELGRLWRPRLLGEGTPEGRAAVGRALGRLGLDDRRGVGLRKDGVPDIEWVRILGGEFIYQEGERPSVETFYMARYPVTNLQYQAFLDDAKGHAAERWWEGMTNPVWTPAKGAWEEGNSPRESVNWWEAMAYCGWLSEKLGYQVTLPTEWQWERAARGTDGREYPWGEGNAVGRANINGLIGRTSAVGIYPTGRSPEGVMDLSGNVWEWCLNEYEKPERTQAGGTEPRVLRGGGWDFNSDRARAAFRGNGRPDDRGNDIGFRPVCSSPIR